MSDTPASTSSAFAAFAPRLLRCSVAAVLGSLGLFALSASGSEPVSDVAAASDAATAAAVAGLDASSASPILPAGPADAGSAAAPVLAADAAAVAAETALSAAEEREAEGSAAEPNGEGEGQVATFPVPQFASLAAIPRSQDYLAQAVLREGKLVVDPPATEAAGQEQSAEPRTLTVDPKLQSQLTALLKSYSVPYGAVAAVEPATGRVLALAEYSHDQPTLRGLPLKAVYPAASVFKMVTGTALVEAGVSTDESVCFHGGKHRLSPKLLADSRRDYRCSTLAQAMGHSLNVVYAKLADRKLDGKTLRAAAERLGFNAPLAFDEPADVSVARIPDEGFDFAKTAAGFGEVFLSPLHGALLAAAVGNGGVMMSPVLFEDETGKAKRVMEEKTAKSVAEMCALTVSEGTARKAFRERGRPVLGKVEAAGKTGTIHDQKPFRDFTWFVGWAPKDDPKIAVAAVVVNGPMWRVHAPYLGREALRMYLDPTPAPKPSASKSKAKANSGTRRSVAKSGNRYASR